MIPPTLHAKKNMRQPKRYSHSTTTLTADQVLSNDLNKQYQSNQNHDTFPLNPDGPIYEELGYQLNLDNILQIFNELFLDIYNKKEPGLQNIMLMGARGSGKTYPVTDFIEKLFILVPNCISYVVRAKFSQMNQTKIQMLNSLKEKGFPVIPKVTSLTNPQIIIKNPYLVNTTTWDNQIIFKSLNPEKNDTESGGMTGETSGIGAKLIVVFFEECTALEPTLIRQFLQSVRGDANTRILTIYASNPGSSTNGYVKGFNEILPPNINQMEQLGYQLTIKPIYSKIDNEDIFNGNALAGRSAVFLNPYLPKTMLNQLKAVKEFSPTQYNIVYLGIDGIAEGGLYTIALNKMSEVEEGVYQDDDLNQGEVVAGLDWGNGTSEKASPTTIHLGLINPTLGLRVLREYTYYNNKNPADDPTIMSYCIQGLKEQGLGLNEIRPSSFNKIRCFVDDAVSPAFVDAFNNLVEPNGANRSIVEFYGANKYYIPERVEVTNGMLGYGQLRIDRSACPMLMEALASCKQILPKHGFDTENATFKRSHEGTHWINSGVEYIMNDYFYTFRTKPAMIYGWDKIEEEQPQIKEDYRNNG